MLAHEGLLGWASAAEQDRADITDRSQASRRDASGESLEELQKACSVQMTPMADVKSTLVPKCPTKALGTCIGAKNGKSSKSDHYHYTPQTPPEWIKAKKNCEKAGGEWYGLGNPTSWF